MDSSKSMGSSKQQCMEETEATSTSFVPLPLAHSSAGTGTVVQDLFVQQHSNAGLRNSMLSSLENLAFLDTQAKTKSTLSTLAVAQTNRQWMNRHGAAGAVRADGNGAATSASPGTEEKKLLDVLQNLYKREEYAGVISLQEEVIYALRVRVSKACCAEMACILATALYFEGEYTPAIGYYKIAYSLHSDDPVGQVSSVARKDTQHDVFLIRVCAGIGQASAAVGEYEEADAYFMMDLALRERLGLVAQETLLVLMVHAQNLHKLNRHAQAMDLLHSVLPEVNCRAGICASDGQGGGTSHSVYGTVCPMLVLGRCHMALCDYKRAAQCFVCARDQAEQNNDKVSTARAELEYAMATWTYCKSAFTPTQGSVCRGEYFMGAPLSPGMVQKKIVQLVATACAEQKGTAGGIAVFVQTNRSGDVTSVRPAKRRGSEMAFKLLPIEWRQVEAAQLDDHGYPVRLELDFGKETTTPVTFTCHLSRTQDIRYFYDGGSSVPVINRVAAVCKPHPCLEAFLSQAMQNAQHDDKRQHDDKGPYEAGMVRVIASLIKAENLADQSKQIELQGDSIIQMAFFSIQSGLHEWQTAKILKKYLTLQVQHAKKQKKDARRCLGCNQVCRNITVCGGCTVVSFCNVTHQKNASNQPFFSTTLPHKKLCRLLLLCKTYTRALSKAKEHTTQEITQLAQQYDQAVLQFLQRGAPRTRLVP